MNEEETQLFFSQWGTVLEVILARSANGMSRGFGFVVFEELVAMNAALEEVNGMELKEGLKVKVEEYKGWRDISAL